ncbi:MAG TPA: PAS domain-containing protein [Geobacteraceae bacterium]
MTLSHDPLHEPPQDLREFLDSISVPIVLVDADGVIRTANRHALAMFQKDAAEIEGGLGGDVFECIYAKLPEGCGHTVHCAGCAIRQSVMLTHLTGQNAMRVPASLKMQCPQEPQEIRFLISTEKFCDHVMLTIAPIPKTP